MIRTFVVISTGPEVETRVMEGDGKDAFTPTDQKEALRAAIDILYNAGYHMGEHPMVDELYKEFQLKIAEINRC